MFTLLYGEFTQDSTHQILLGSAEFRLRYNKNNFGVYFGSQCIYVCPQIFAAAKRWATA